MSSNKNDKLVIEAQEYGLGNKLREKLTPTGWRRAITEKLSPTFNDRMETLRLADDTMRQIAGDFRTYLANASKAFKDGRYLDVAHWTSELNRGARNIINNGKKVVDLRDSEIAEYYTRHEEADPNGKFFEDDTNAEDGLEAVTAGISDLLNRFLGTSLEKTYWRRVKERKLAVQSLLKQAEKLVAIVLGSLNRMGNARARGNINDWIVELQRIGQAQVEFQKFAKGIYDKHLADLVEIAKSKSVQKPKYELEVDKIPNEVDVPKAQEFRDELGTEKVLPKTEPINLNKNIRPVMPQIPDLAAPESVEKTTNINNPIKPVEAPIVPDLDVPENTQNVNTSELILEPEKSNSVPVVQQLQMTTQNPNAVEVEKTPIPATNLIQEVKNTIPEQNQVKRERGRPRAGTDPNKELNQWEKLKELLQKDQTQLVENKTNIPTSVKEVSAPTKVVPEVVEEVKVSTEIPSINFDLPPVEVAKVQAPIPVPKAQEIPKQPVRVNVRGRPPNSPKAPKAPLPPPQKPIVEEKSENVPNIENNNLALEPVTEPIPESPTAKNTSESENKITLVLLPKGGGIEDLDVLKENLVKEFGHDVEFVTKDTGREVVTRYKEENYDIDLKTYDEVKNFTKPEKIKASMMNKLDDPKFIANLPRTANGDFHMPSILDLSIFSGLDKGTRNEVVQKLLAIRENEEKNGITPEISKEKEIEEVTPEEEEEEEEVIPEELVPEEKPIEEKIPEVKLPKETKPIQEEAKKVVKPVEEETESDEFVPSKEDKEAEAIYIHTGNLEKLLAAKGTKLRDLTNLSVLNLIDNPKYIAILPKDKDGNFDTELIKKFPEFNMLQKTYQNSFLKQLKEMNAPRKKRVANSVDDIFLKLSNKRFYNELSKVSKLNNPGLMAAMLCKYSEEIEFLDENLSIKLIEQAGKLIDV